MARWPTRRLAAWLSISAAALLTAGPSVADTQGSSPPPLALEATAAATSALQPASAARARFADFGAQAASPDARHVADWVADTRDNGDAGFFIVDKPNARLHVFDANARLRATSPVLIGSAPGDHTVPGIGTRPISEILPHERTTPAGRFLAERGRNLRGEDVVWVDYDAAVSMHRVLTTNPRERRLERLATPTATDNRISYGCINVPVAFYETHVRPAFATQRAVVYVLPDVLPVQAVFGSYDVAAADGIAAGQLAAADPCTHAACAAPGVNAAPAR